MNQTAIDHEAITELLPWYVNETLDGNEREQVRDHLRVCSSCRDDVAMLEQLGNVVRRNSPSPLVPAAQPDELLAYIDHARRNEVRGRRWKSAGIAASVLVVVIMGIVMLVRDGANPVDGNVYETVTHQTDGTVEYVIELRLDGSLDDADRDALFADLGASSVSLQSAAGTYRVTLESASLSLSELEQYVSGIEQRDGVAEVRVVGVQLPVE